MSQGLQIWDANGGSVLDTTTGTVKILGKFGYNPNPVTITHPLLATEDTFFMIFPPFPKLSAPTLKVVFSGSSATVYNTIESAKKTIYVGVY